MSVTSSKLLDGVIAGLFTAVLLTMKDLVMYQVVNWSLTMTISLAAFAVCALVLPTLRKKPQSRSRRIAG
ncbi:hypothetical protein [Alkalicoccobacillus murimartini]|uniref:Uncharacterized protein n=1 Tax=Alkalicoccobacillus murimartini TaxID=171685 RepID=A0ABT9YFD2_9BACI|nr:hypothetical protein [Alkalicoccobacillus murimartini]MDQ0206556.1 hypothetical protein [Alkalicoccobacillus murimartini]